MLAWWASVAGTRLPKSVATIPSRNSLRGRHSASDVWEQYSVEPARALGKLFAFEWFESSEGPKKKERERSCEEEATQQEPHPPTPSRLVSQRASLRFPPLDIVPGRDPIEIRLFRERKMQAPHLPSLWVV